MVAVSDFSGLTSAAWALAKAAANAATDSLDRCMADLPLQDVEAHRTRLRTLGAHPVPNALLGVLRHQGLEHTRPHSLECGRPGERNGPERDHHPTCGAHGGRDVDDYSQQLGRSPRFRGRWRRVHRRGRGRPGRALKTAREAEGYKRIVRTLLSAAAEPHTPSAARETRGSSWSFRVAMARFLSCVSRSMLRIVLVRSPSE